MGDSPRGRKESDATDVTEHAHMRTSGAKTPPRARPLVLARRRSRAAALAAGHGGPCASYRRSF